MRAGAYITEIDVSVFRVTNSARFGRAVAMMLEIQAASGGTNF